MSRASLLRAILINLVLIPLTCLYLSKDAFPFTSEDEYLSHTEGQKSCTSSQCHSQFTVQRKAFRHEPVSAGECNACHKAEAYPNKYGIEPNQIIICSRCHKGMEQEIKSSQFVHGPIKNGDCLSCHNPHESDTLFFLRESYSKLCSSCHSLKRFFSGESIHKPVKDGNCGLCHDPHASNFKSRLTDVGANLCLPCHDDMVSGMTQDYIHNPLIQSGCTDCHDPHSGKDTLRLTSLPEKICFTCHEEKRNEIDQYTQKHEPASNGQCTVCHSPHYSGINYILLDEIDTLCYKCHKENSIWKKRQFQHGPVVQGNCTACHNPHGSDNAFILRLSFPNKFYTPYEKGKYDLCFICHKEALVTAEKTTTVTHFRNGDINLHRLHVNQQKGRTCRACHDIHASDQEDHIREEFPFGAVNIPIYYFKTETGGSCIPGCHKERGYDRVNVVDNTN
jgi:predicted CXXCH cytochrome family protein